MKKLFIISKTHLDLGFTDYAENIYKKYLDSFIPNSIKIAQELNTETEKNFVWTVGSWLIKEALKNSSEKNKQELVKALKNGNIVPHAMPFTTHTELLDEDTLDYGLSIVDEIDKIIGRKTIVAKMTDVPGHTKALVPVLAKHGIKLLHIGVNGASAMPNVPTCFLWKCGDSEVAVIYSGDYGGAFECDYIDDILYFDHTLDNHGAGNKNAIMKKVNQLKSKYPEHEIAAGRMDDYAELLWQVKDKLPVITGEIGDSWIHGGSADPYKSASLRTLMALKCEWLADGSMQKGSEEYINFSDNLLCIAEHTCGMDMKMYFADYENYLRKDFEKARKKDKVIIKHIFRDFPQNFLSLISKIFGGNWDRSYTKIEKSWSEQRKYIIFAVAVLSDVHKKQAEYRLNELRPQKPVDINNNLKINEEYSIDNWKISINKNGGIKSLYHNGNLICSANDNPVLQYHSYGQNDYDFWLNNYTRNIKETYTWAVGDFARPLLKYADKKYKQGRFSYTLKNAEVRGNKIIVDLGIDNYCCENLGAAKKAQIIYSVENDKFNTELFWFDKSANRLTESTIIRFYPACKDDTLRYTKIGQKINPYDVVQNGNRNLSVTQNIIFGINDKKYQLTNLHSPITALGKGKILKFDNKYESVEKDGVSYILHNNVWGTNFPLWYEDNAYFKFELKEINT